MFRIWLTKLGVPVFKGTVTDPLLVPVCSCLRENVIIVTCKILSVWCSLDKFLLKNVID